jgi:hypothetical protein
MYSLYSKLALTVILLSIPNDAHAECNSNFGEEELVNYFERSQSVESIPVGEFELVHKGGNPEKGTLGLSDFDRILAFRDVGLVDLSFTEGSAPPDDSSKHAWDIWEELISTGRHRIRISPTNLGREENLKTYAGKKSAEGDKRFENKLFVESMSEPTELLDFVRTKTFEARTGIYAVALYTYRLHWRDISANTRLIAEKYCSFREPDEKCSYMVKGERKAKTLLKLDDFKCRWNAVASDYADMNSDFESSRVDQLLNDLK